MIKKIINGISLLLCIITCIIFGIYIYLHYSIIPTYQQKLLTIANNREDEIETYITQQEKNAIKLSQKNKINNFLYNATNKISNKIDQQTIASFINQYKDTMDFKNILLIDKYGTICFSTTQQNIIGINIKEDAYIHSSLGKSYERTSMTLTNDFSHFTFNNLLQEPTLFITIPLLKDKKFIGALMYQLNQEKIYLITHQYIGLEKTGEVVLAKKDDQYVVFLTPTRNDPDLSFKKRILVDDQPVSVQASVLGKEGSGIGIDYRGKQVLGVWKFITKLDWGMIVKIDLSEILYSAILTYKIALLFFFIFIISLSFSIYLFYPLIIQKLRYSNNTFPLRSIPPLLKNPLFIALLFFCCLTIKNIIIFQKEVFSTIKKAKNKVEKTTIQNADTIETILNKIAFTAESIAHDLQTDYLAEEDILTRIKRDIAENHSITQITVVTVPLINNHAAKFLVQSTHTITDQNNILKTKWYTKAIKNDHVWLTDIEQNHLPTGIYAYSFIDKKQNIQRVIAIHFALTEIINIAEDSGIGQTGYSFIIDKKGTFIFHPIKNLIYTKSTLLQYAQLKGNEELSSIAKKITNNTAQMNSYISESTKERFWMYTQPITTNNWIIGSLFSEAEVAVPSEIIRHHYFWILTWSIISFLLFFALLCSYSTFSLTYFALITNIILLLALTMSWHIIKKTTKINRESRTIITDQSSLNKFLNDLNDEASRKHEAPPINIPCGILLYSLSIADSNHISFSGYIWNKYNINKHQHIGRGMELPQATKITFGNPLTSESDTETVATTWNIQGILFQEQDHSKYPFDQQQIRIILEHKDIEKNIILTPDLVAYKKISPESIPGLDKEFYLSGFTIEQTFFEYHYINPSANFGFKEYGKVTDNYQLVYNAIMNRDLLNPFIFYILPLLVILFSLFTTLLLIKKTTDPLTILGAYSALFFSLILLQRSLREQHATGTTLYIEYAFFYTYLTIIMLIFHTIALYYYHDWQKYHNKSLYCMKILFWPLQLLSWLITTLIIFY